MTALRLVWLALTSAWRHHLAAGVALLAYVVVFGAYDATAFWGAFAVTLGVTTVLMLAEGFLRAWLDFRRDRREVARFRQLLEAWRDERLN